jgi:AraC-like DNA-binding protein
MNRLLRRAGLPVYCDDPAALVPLRRAWALFEATAQTVDPSVGWHVGRFVGDNHLSAGLLKRLEHAPTLYQSLHRLVRLISSEASHLKLGIGERHDDIVFYTSYSTLKDWPGYAVSQAYQLEVYIDIVRHYLGRNWVPEEMGIEHSVVPAVAQEHFPDTRILPNQPLGYITVPRACLHRSASPPAPQSTQEESVTLSSDFDLVDTLRAMVSAYLPDGYPSVPRMAAVLEMSGRTLIRRLAERGLTYQGVIDEVRFRSATDLLRDSGLPIGDIARSVGFDDPAHFARMFRRVGGSSPRQFRKSVSA